MQVKARTSTGVLVLQDRRQECTSVVYRQAKAVGHVVFRQTTQTLRQMRSTRVIQLCVALAIIVSVIVPVTAETQNVVSRQMLNRLLKGSKGGEISAITEEIRSNTDAILANTDAITEHTKSQDNLLNTEESRFIADLETCKVDYFARQQVFCEEVISGVRRILYQCSQILYFQAHRQFCEVVNHLVMGSMTRMIGSMSEAERMITGEGLTGRRGMDLRRFPLSDSTLLNREMNRIPTSSLHNKDLNRIPLSESALLNRDLNIIPLSDSALLNGIPLSDSALLNRELNRIPLSDSALLNRELNGMPLSGSSLLNRELNRIPLSEAALLNKDLLRMPLSESDLLSSDILNRNRIPISQAGLLNRELLNKEVNGLPLESALLNRDILNRNRIPMTETGLLNRELLNRNRIPITETDLLNRNRIPMTETDLLNRDILNRNRIPMTEAALLKRELLNRSPLSESALLNRDLLDRDFLNRIPLSDSALLNSQLTNRLITEDRMFPSEFSRTTRLTPASRSPLLSDTSIEGMNRFRPSGIMEELSRDGTALPIQLTPRVTPVDTLPRQVTNVDVDIVLPGAVDSVRPLPSRFDF